MNMILLVIASIIQIVLIGLLIYGVVIIRKGISAFDSMLVKLMEQNQVFVNAQTKINKNSTTLLETISKQIKELHGIKQYAQTIKDASENGRELIKISKIIESDIKKFGTVINHLNIIADKIQKK